jgi:hypothetical protein
MSPEEGSGPIYLIAMSPVKIFSASQPSPSGLSQALENLRYEDIEPHLADPIASTLWSRFVIVREQKISHHCSSIADQFGSEFSSSVTVSSTMTCFENLCDGFRESGSVP